MIPPDETDGTQNDLSNVVGNALEQVALLAARAGRWELARRTLAELSRRGIGAEVAAQVAAIAAEAGEWEIAGAALQAVSGK